MTPTYHDYLERWRARFPEPRSVRWENGGVRNDYCPDCGYCCGPQDSDEPFYMALLPEQRRPDLADDFHLRDELTAYLDGRGCKACGEHGCRLPEPCRPPACGLFPLVAANGGLYLYQTCPAVMLNPPALFADLGRIAARRLAAHPEDVLRRICLELPEAVLARCYSNLHIRLYETEAPGL